MNVATSDNNITSEERKTHQRRVNVIGKGLLKLWKGS